MDGFNRLIDKSADVHPEAWLGVGVIIGPKVQIARRAMIGHYSVIGTPPEHRDFVDDGTREDAKGVIIGPDVRIFEFVTVHSGTKRPTLIAAGSMVQNHSHIAHDCYLEAETIIGGQVSLAGHTHVCFRAVVAGKSCTHQFSAIGHFGFLAPMSFLKGALPPGEIWSGHPARPAGINRIGLERAGLSHEECIRTYGSAFETGVGATAVAAMKGRQ